MSGFSGDWLALREPADHAARDPGLLHRLASHLAGRASLRIVDLGAGTGSNLRALAPALDAPQRWLLVDNDPRLTERLGPVDGVAIDVVPLDLASAPSPVEGADLVTTAAFLDLVSAAWAGRLADDLARARVPLYAVLSYDGTARFAPAHPLDDAVRDAVNRHQRGDKGFGPALGPDAPAHLAAELGARGFAVHLADSPWRLGPGERDLQYAFLQGWFEAASEAMAFPPGELERWLSFRHAAVAGGGATVGHEDLLALPPAV